MLVRIAEEQRAVLRHEARHLGGDDPAMLPAAMAPTKRAIRALRTDRAPEQRRLEDHDPHPIIGRLIQENVILLGKQPEGAAARDLDRAIADEIEPCSLDDQVELELRRAMVTWRALHKS